MSLPSIPPPGHLVANEQALTNHLVAHAKEAGCQVLAREWEAFDIKGHRGKGDLVLELPSGMHAVVEVKNLHSGTGPTASSSRNHGRTEVVRQANYYRDCWKQAHPGAKVVGAVFTSDKGLKKL